MTNQNQPEQAEWENQIEDAVSEAYEIGHVHGGNPFRKPPQRVNDGWGKCLKKIIDIFQKKEAEYKKEMKYLLQDAGEHCLKHVEQLKQQHKKEILFVNKKHKEWLDQLKIIDKKTEKLKQQHREQIEGLRMIKHGFESREVNEDWYKSIGYNQAVDEINSKIDTLLQTITTEV